MTEAQLTQHLIDGHGVDPKVATEVIGHDPESELTDASHGAYLRGFHDGAHGRVDADDLTFPGHGGH